MALLRCTKTAGSPCRRRAGTTTAAARRLARRWPSPDRCRNCPCRSWAACDWRSSPASTRRYGTSTSSATTTWGTRPWWSPVAILGLCGGPVAGLVRIWRQCLASEATRPLDRLERCPAAGRFAAHGGTSPLLNFNLDPLPPSGFQVVVAVGHTPARGLGSSVTEFAPGCWKVLSTPTALRASAIEPPIGSTLDKPKAEAKKAAIAGPRCPETSLPVPPVRELPNRLANEHPEHRD